MTGTDTLFYIVIPALAIILIVGGIIEAKRDTEEFYPDRPYDWEVDGL